MREPLGSLVSVMEKQSTGTRRRLCSPRYFLRLRETDSFNQFVLLDQDDIVMLNHGDGYPRAVALNRLSSSGRNGSVYMAEYGDPKDADLDDMRILNDTGVAVGGFVQSSTHYIMAYNEINPDLWYDLAVSQTFRESETARNIMIAAVPKDDLTQENVVRTAVTDYPDDGVSGGNPFLVPVGNDRFLLLWQHGEKVHYVFTDGTGALSGEQYELEGCLSDCEPVVSGGKLYWYTWEQSDIRFYSIDLEHPEQTDIVKRKAAHEMAQTEQDAAGNVYDVCTKCGLRVPHDDPDGYQVLLFRISRSDDRWVRTLFRPETEYLEVGDEIALRIDQFNIDEERFFRMYLRGEAELPFDYDTWLYTVSEFDAPAVVFEIQLEPDMHRNRIQNVRFMAKHNYEYVSMQQADGETAGSITLQCADCGHTATFAADALSGTKDAAVCAALENDSSAAPAVTVTLTDPETGEETEAEQGNDFTAAYVKDPDTGQSYAVIVAAKDSGKLRGSAVIPFDGTQPERPAGDVNADGKFDSADAVLLQQWLLNIPDTELKDWKAADLSADNRLDAHDLSMMKMVLMQ